MIMEHTTLVLMRDEIKIRSYIETVYPWIRITMILKVI